MEQSPPGNLLGLALERMLGSWRAYRTLEATVTTWVDELPWRAAERRMVRELSGPGAERAFGSTEAGIHESRRHWWVSPPDRFRSEILHLDEGGREWRQVTIRNGVRGWRWSTRTRRLQSFDRGHVELACLLDPSPWLQHLNVSVVGEEVIDGRKAVRLQAQRHRAPGDADTWVEPVGLARGADTYSLCIDLTLGIVLASESHFDGFVIERFRIADVVVDRAIPEGRFHPDPDAGPLFETPKVRHVMPHEALTCVPFTVYTAGHSMRSWTIRTLQDGQVELSGVIQSAADRITLRQRLATDAAPPSDAMVIDRDGHRLIAIERVDGIHEVFLTLGGTDIAIGPSALPVEDLCSIAVGLRPLPPPPTLVDA